MAVSPLKVPVHGWYATRTQIVVLVDRHGDVTLVARDAWMLEPQAVEGLEATTRWSGQEHGRWRFKVGAPMREEGP